MEILSVFDKAFCEYGQVLKGYDTAELIAAMKAIPMPESGVSYMPGIDSLEKCAVYEDFSNRGYGGMPVQVGMCWGYNTKLNCLEYHRDSELNIGSRDFILLLATVEDIVDGKLDTSKVKAFLAKAGQVVEVYETTLHYAPCSAKKGEGFKTIVVLPKGTNGSVPNLCAINEEDKWLTACNKWLLAHAEASEAKDGAYVGLTGENIDIANLI